MCTRTNPSALQSREWIHDALLELLQQKKYDQITIKDLEIVFSEKGKGRKSERFVR